ncbi:MAG: DNA polymerase IV, partial [Agathobacter sp.]|nr:DNA polymerase IV [Agathobacter sp.]MBQ6812886.1 DNA polymerase IV [Agathobacter sp.]
MKPVIFHIDVNSAFLSWEATYRMRELGDTEDLRLIPSAVGGSEESRHGIVLAKSESAKKYGVTTGEPLVDARRKCPVLKTVPANFPIYVKYSNAMMKILEDYSPDIEQYSIDESFIDMTGTEKLFGNPIQAAHMIKDRIYNELGFTVNIGISTNKLLAKMASDFKKPNLVHTLFPEEVPTKMWPLPVSELFFVGRQTAKRLHALGIFTIGDLAKTDKKVIQDNLKGHGEVIWEFANGIGDSMEDVASKNRKPANKGYSNETTLAFDVTDASLAKEILLSLTETVATRIRADKSYVSVVSVYFVDNEFKHTSRQMTLDSATNVTNEIYHHVCQLFDQLWNGNPIRLLGVQTSKATNEANRQYSLFENQNVEKLSKLDSAIDAIRNKYGEDSIKRASFVHTEDGDRPNHMT